LPFNHLSDHCLISLSISVNFKKTDAKRDNNIFKLPGKFIWDTKGGDNFIKAFAGKSMDTKLSNFKNNNFKDVDTAISQFNSLTKEVARTSLKFIHPRIKKNTTKKTPKNKNNGLIMILVRWVKH
jgi:hypothetical protein